MRRWVTDENKAGLVSWDIPAIIQNKCKEVKEMGVRKKGNSMRNCERRIRKIRKTGYVKKRQKNFAKDDPRGDCFV